MKIQVNDIEVNLLVGADPEIFVMEDSKLVSAFGLVPGFKDNPHKVPKGAIQVDGMALEFNIDPADSQESFVENVNVVLTELESRLPAKYSLASVSTAEFGADYISKQPEEARELGCSPDLSAYTQMDNPRPDVKAPFRTAAGHVHIGWTSYADTKDYGYVSLCCDFTKVLDVYLGLPSVLEDPDTKRRELYGQAGALRVKSYGLEYRVLSNYWLKSDALKNKVYQRVVEAMKAFLGGLRVEDSDVKRAINTSDKQLAGQLMSKYGVN